MKRLLSVVIHEAICEACSAVSNNEMCGRAALWLLCFVSNDEISFFFITLKPRVE